MNLMLDVHRNPFNGCFYFVVFRDGVPIAVFDDEQSVSVYLASLESEVAYG